MWDQIRKRGALCYPEDDNQFEDKTIESVKEAGNGAFSITCDGWSLWTGENCPVKPEVGQISRHYGKGIGYAVRGLFINGVKVWYRTEAEQKDFMDIQSYGADAKDWLQRWDEGKSVWSIEMGGLGPSYEQCIQITTAEVVRWFVEHHSDATKWAEPEGWTADREPMTADVQKLKPIQELGLSGAQWGAAVNLATRLYLNGPRFVMNDEGVKDRHIQVQKFFPGSVAA